MVEYKFKLGDKVRFIGFKNRIFFNNYENPKVGDILIITSKHYLHGNSRLFYEVAGYDKYFF